jgi:hypothetical protein
MTLNEELASFIVKASYDDLSSGAKAQLKIRVLASLVVAETGRWLPGRKVLLPPAKVMESNFQGGDCLWN